MTTWWLAGSYPAIQTVEVEKYTEASVWIRGRRHARTGEFYSYFQTWAEAKDHLVRKAQGAVDRARRNLERANSELGNMKGLKEPPPAAPAGEG